MEATNAIFYIAILIMSIVIHEVSHGFMAEYFGDDTARDAGRLTLNPIKHLDIFGSILLPAFLFLSGTKFLFGWAKPVPYNPNNLSNKKWGTVWVAAAGVLSNFTIAIIFGLIIRFAPSLFPSLAFMESFYFITSTIVLVNLSLGIFNLVPIPPLDGSKILFALLPESFNKVLEFLEQYSFVLLIAFIILFSQYLTPIMLYIYLLLTSLAF